MVRHNNAAEERGALSSRVLNPSCISYEPKIKSKTIQGERNRYGLQRAMGGQGGQGAKVQATVHDESQVDVSIYGFWK